MPTNEKEYNGNLIDKLNMLDDIEEVADSGDIEAVKKIIAKKRKQIERMLYQNPPLLENN